MHLTIDCTSIECTSHGTMCNRPQQENKVEVLDGILLRIINSFCNIYLVTIFIGIFIYTTKNTMQAQTICTEEPLVYDICFTVIEFERWSTRENTVLVYIHILYISKSLRVNAHVILIITKTFELCLTEEIRLRVITTVGRHTKRLTPYSSRHYQPPPIWNVLCDLNDVSSIRAKNISNSFR